MKKREVEERLNKCISDSVPDVLDSILKKCEEKKGFNLKMQTNTNKEVKVGLFSKYAMVLGLVIIMLGLGFGLNSKRSVSVIEFDVNPSIELKVNKKEKVVDVIPINEDAKKVLNNMDLENVDLDVAVNALVGSMLKNGYLSIDNNSILVSVKNNDKKESERLQKQISEEINSLLKASSIEGAILTQELIEDDNLTRLSNDNNISIGKAKLISNVINAKITNNKGELYTFEQLANLSINELNVLLTEKNTKVENIKATGAASQTGYIGKDKAKDIAVKDANVELSKIKKIEIEFDADSGKLTYEVDFQVDNKEYEYDIDAKTGKILHKETDIDEDYVEKNDKTNNTSTNKNNSTSNNTSTSYIGKTKAKSIAFKNAGVSSSKVRELEVEFDKDDGVASYEIDFKVGNKEYSYDINAKTGKIIDKEVEIDD